MKVILSAVELMGEPEIGFGPGEASIGPGEASIGLGGGSAGPDGDYAGSGRDAAQYMEEINGDWQEEIPRDGMQW